MACLGVATLLLLAGCLGGGEEPGLEGVATNDTNTSGAFAFDVVELDDDCGNCWEPTVAVFDGVAYAAPGPGETIHLVDLTSRETDTVTKPPLPSSVPPVATTGDDTLQVDEGGRLYFTALLCDATCGDLGIQVAMSTDDGKTWSLNTVVNPVGQPASPTVFLDRQWLGFGDGDRVYMTWSQYAPRTGVWTAVSEDAGESWGQFTRAHPVEEDKPFGSPGLPVVTEDEVLLPGRGGSQVHVDVSTDGGSSWSAHEVHTLEGTSVDRWANGAADAEGTTHLVWTTADGQVHYTRAESGSEGWAQPTAWAERDADVPPSIAIDAGEVHIAWFAETGDGWQVHAATSPIETATDGPDEVVGLEPELASSSRPTGGSDPHTDFAHADATEDGRFVVTYSTGDSLQLAIEAPAGAS